MNSHKIFTKRLRVLAIVVLLLMSSILVRMVEKMIIEGDHYSALADDQHRFEKTKQGQRGKIYVHDKIEGDETLYPLSFDIKSYAVMVVPNQVMDKTGTAKELSSLLIIDTLEIYNKIDNDKLYIPPLKKGLTYEESEVIKEKDMAGVFLIPEYDRLYPEKSLASHVLGFVNAEGKGNYGFEGHYDDELKGTIGKISGEKDTLGRIITLLEEGDTKDGTSYVLTLDRSVQYYIEKTLAKAIEDNQADSGTVVVMDIKTGGIVAMASNPSFDPNNFKAHAAENPGVFVNPAIAYLYEPGSVFKAFIMAAAIDQGVVEPDTKETFTNFTIVDGYEIHTATDKAYGEQTMTQVLENSDNVAMVWLAEKLGKEKMYEYINDFGFLDRTNIDLDSEATGSVPKLKLWRDIHRATISFGQGIAVTAIEMVAACSAIANDGVYIYPRLVDKIMLPGGEEKQVEKAEGSRIVSSETSKKMGEMLQSVVDNGYGNKARVEGFRVGGKTGTAQISNPEGGYFEDQFIHSFMGYAPIEDPRFVLMVKLDNPKSRNYSSDTAAPVWGDIASYLLNFYYRLAPSQ